jgi:hypothetical protein
MGKQTSVNLDITNNPDGFDISGGTTARKLAVTGGNVTFVGGNATYTLPSDESGTVALRGANTFNGNQTVSGSLTVANGITFGGGATFLAFYPQSAPNGGLWIRNGNFQVGGSSFGANQGVFNFNPSSESHIVAGNFSFNTNLSYQAGTNVLTINTNEAHTGRPLRISRGTNNFIAGCEPNGTWFGTGFTGGTATFSGKVSIGGGIVASGDILATSSNITLNGSLTDILAPAGVIRIGDPDGANNGIFIEVHDLDALITASGMVDLQNGVQSGYTRLEWGGLTTSYDLIPTNWASLSATMNTSPTQNSAYFAPIFVSRRIRIRTMATQTGSNGSGNSGNILFGLYDSNTYGYPKDRLYISSSIGLSTGNFVVQRATGVDVILNPGQYWLAIIFSAASIPTVGLGRWGGRIKTVTSSITESPLSNAGVDGLRKDQGSFTLATTQSGSFTEVLGQDNPAIFYTAEVV